MAKIILINIGNSLDSSNYSRVVIVPDDYGTQEVKMAIDCGDIKLNLEKDFSGEFVHSIAQVKADYCAFTEDDFLCIQQTVKDLHII